MKGAKKNLAYGFKYFWGITDSVANDFHAYWNVHWLKHSAHGYFQFQTTSLISLLLNALYFCRSWIHSLGSNIPSSMALFLWIIISNTNWGRKILHFLFSEVYMGFGFLISVSSFVALVLEIKFLVTLELFALEPRIWPEETKPTNMMAVTPFHLSMLSAVVLAVILWSKVVQLAFAISFYIYQ